MQSSIPEEVSTAQRDVQRLLGRCLLRLQQFEALLKAVVAFQDISGPVQALEQIRDARVAETSEKTLGNLIGRLFSSYVVPEGFEPPDTTPDPPDGSISIGFRMHLSLREEAYDQMQADLRELVTLRNRLVHHFIEQHDLWTAEGCCTAKEALTNAYVRIDRSYEELRGIAAHMDKARLAAQELFSTPQFVEMTINGIGPDGTVHWPISGVVGALREAARHLAIDGWTKVDAAARWIRKHRPEQTPEKYGCSRFRHVIHVSGQFEMRRMTHHGQHGAWYRECPAGGQDIEVKIKL